MHMLAFFYFSLIHCILLLFTDSYVTNRKIRPKALHSARLEDKDIDRYSLADIEEYAKKLNVELKKSIIGPYLKLEAVSLEENKVVGYLTGFVRPLTGLLQLETIQVRNRRQSLQYRAIPKGIEGKGVSFILGSWTLRWAFSMGCKSAELLAVRDDPVMENILIKLYESYGYKKKAVINEGDIGNRMVWGAVGTLMSIDIPAFLDEWTPKIRQLLMDAETNKLS
jgi:hypothetical protein